MEDRGHSLLKDKQHAWDSWVVGPWAAVGALYDMRLH